MLDPFYAEQLKMMAAAGGPSLSDMTPEEGRQMYLTMQQMAPRPDILSVSDQVAAHPDGDIPIRVYRVSGDAAQPCLVFYHGGGWVIGDLETHDHVCRQIANSAACTVIAVDYRLAPEHPFPAAIDDCYAATTWIAANADSLNIDSRRIAVGGDSAGGNLAACVSLAARDRNGPSLVAQILIYPVTDTGTGTASYAENADGYLLTRDSMVWFWDHYLQDKSRAGDAMVAPLQAISVADLPAATVLTAEYDPLRDEGEAYGARLKDAGNDAVVTRYAGLIHGFFGATEVSGARDAMGQVSARLRAAFGTG
jgi:acetyl esterase